MNLNTLTFQPTWFNVSNKGKKINKPHAVRFFSMIPHKMLINLLLNR